MSKNKVEKVEVCQVVRTAIQAYLRDHGVKISEDQLEGLMEVVDGYYS